VESERSIGEGMTIGDYEIRNFIDGTFWIEFPSGEGMQISKERLEYWLEQIYKKDF
jgi:G:T-mismatch repair DNA endonuclease (very short patch repair protein)